MKKLVLSIVLLSAFSTNAHETKISTPAKEAPKAHCEDELKADGSGKPGKCESLSKVSANQFGAAVKGTKPISVDEAIAQLNKSQQPTLLVEAKVDKVCLKKGCWMALKSKTTDVRVTFKDYGFFVPVSLVGKTVWVEGRMSEKKLSLAQTKHYVEDEGGDPSKVTEARTDYQFEATGVLVKN
jgi:hypothetical protein